MEFEIRKDRGPGGGRNMARERAPGAGAKRRAPKVFEFRSIHWGRLRPYG